MCVCVCVCVFVFMVCINMCVWQWEERWYNHSTFSLVTFLSNPSPYSSEHTLTPNILSLSFTSLFPNYFTVLDRTTTFYHIVSPEYNFVYSRTHCNIYWTIYSTSIQHLLNIIATELKSIEKNLMGILQKKI